MMSRRRQWCDAIARSGRTETLGIGRIASGSRRVHLSATIALAVTMAFGSAGSAYAETHSTERVRDIARAEISKRRYQRDLPIPSISENKPEKLDPGSRNRPNAGTDRPTTTPRAPLSESAGEAARVVLWVLLGIVVVLLVVYISNEIPRFLGRRARSSHPAGDGIAPDRTAQTMATPGWIDEADRLARGGAYGPAIHSLLLDLVAALYGRIGRRLSPSLTGREIVVAAGLPAETGAALSRIVAAAERGHFGGYTLGPADYETCRKDYATVSASIGAGA